MDNWERRWKLFLVIIQTDQITVKGLVAKCEAASSTIRADLAHLALTFPIKSRRGNMEDIISPMLTVPSESMLLLLFG